MPQLAADSGILVDQLAQLADHADHLLGHVVAGGSLGAEDIGLGHKVSVRVCLQVQVLFGLFIAFAVLRNFTGFVY